MLYYNAPNCLIILPRNIHCATNIRYILNIDLHMRLVSYCKPIRLVVMLL